MNSYKNLEVELSCSCHTPTLVYDEKYVQVSCSHCECDVFSTDYFKNGEKEFTHENQIEAIKDKIISIIDSNESLELSIIPSKKPSLYGEMHSININHSKFWNSIEFRLYVFDEPEIYSIDYTDSENIGEEIIDRIKYIASEIARIKRIEIDSVRIAQLFTR